MRMNSARVAIIASIFSLAIPAWAQNPEPRVRYDDHKLVEVELRTPADLQVMDSVTPDAWDCTPHLGRMLYRVAPERMLALDMTGLRYHVVVDNLQSLFDAEQQQLSHGTDGDWFTAYHNFTDVVAYLDTLAALRPDLATRFTLGQSIQGRNLQGLRITAPTGRPDKVGVLYDGCQHAREWIAVAVPMYVADRLIKTYDTDMTVRAILQNAVIYVVPVDNPDGYEYTWSTDRNWRKNRRNNGDGTFGVDNNRNWGYQWGLDSGSSGSTSSETYRGTAPFSEPENQTLRDFIIAHPDIAAHIDFHSYGQLILSPWGYSTGEPPEPDKTTFRNLDTQLQAAIKSVHNLTYTAGPTGITLYLASGTMPDWTYGDQGVLGFTIELRPVGSPGFVLPPDQIVPTGEESFAAATLLAEFVSLFIDFNYPTPLPAQAQSGQSTAVNVDIVPMNTTILSGSQTLYTRVGASGGFSAAPLSLVAGNSYIGNLPATTCGQTIYYYFSAQTTGGQTVTSPPDAPATLFSVGVIEQQTLFSDDMEQNHGWTAGAAGDTATAGIWNRQDPNGTSAQPEDDHTVGGTQCWVTDGRSGTNVNSFDVDGGKTTLLSPVLDLSAGGDIHVGYWRWYSNSAGNNPNQDVFTIDITANGSTWVNVETVGPSGAGTSGGWIYHEFQVASLIVPSATVQMRFTASDTGGTSAIEAAIDDFAVVSFACSTPPPCPGDLNGDHQRDLGDLSTMLSAYGTCIGDPGYLTAADLDLSGCIDLVDLSSLLAVYGAVCP